MKGKGESAGHETVNEEYTVRGNVEGFIEETGPSDDYDEIEFLGYEYNVPEDEEDSDVNVHDKQCNRSYDDDCSDDDSYMGQSSSSDIKESVYDDFEAGEFDVEVKSDANEDGLGSKNNDVTFSQPGLNSELVIEEGTSHDYMCMNADPQTQFPIPNEREVRLSRGCNSSEPTRSRSIQFQPKSLTVASPSDLPFQPRGLQWSSDQQGQRKGDF